MVVLTMFTLMVQSLRDDHATIYLSSHTGCALGCKYCHLTATGQRIQTALTRDEICVRLENLLKSRAVRDYDGRFNLAFMARGDALSNANVDESLMRSLYDMLLLHNEYHKRLNKINKVLISTIFPKTHVDDSTTGVYDYLVQRFGQHQPHIYWSLYSLDPLFREHWMPNALDPYFVVKGLKMWQDETFQDVVIHHALINGDSVDSSGNYSNYKLSHTKNIMSLLDSVGLRYRVNLIRYNPAQTKNSGVEADENVYQAVKGLHQNHRLNTCN